MPATVHFLSCEPLLSPLSLDRWWRNDVPGGYYMHGNGLHWIIAGGESGSRARASHPDWFRNLRDQCAAADVPFFFKQWGEWGPTHPDWPKANGKAMANDGTLYDMPDLAWPDGDRRGEAIRAGHDHANLTMMYRPGKKAAGRLLDGIEHNAFPSPAPGRERVASAASRVRA